MRPKHKQNSIAVRRLRLALPAIVSVCLGPAVASAVVVLPKGANKPIMGYLIRQDDRLVTIRQEQAGGKSHELSFNKSEIDELIITVSPQRLATLDPSRPQLYREYAEELAEKQRDPEARDAAIRLYAIVAARGDEKLRHSALLGLISLARSPDEERLFRAAAYLDDPDHDASILTSPAAAQATTGNKPAAELLSAVKLARQGKGPAAKPLLAKPAVQADAERIASIISPEELTEACAGRTLSDVQLRKLLQAELALEAPSIPGPTAETKPVELHTWSQSAQPGRLAPLPAIKLETLTEFNPAECIFRGGKWVTP
jgi:hypothetical protein